MSEKGVVIEGVIEKGIIVIEIWIGIVRGIVFHPLFPEVKLLYLKEGVKILDFVYLSFASAEEFPGQRNLLSATVDHGVQETGFFRIKGKKPPLLRIDSHQITPGIHAHIKSLYQGTLGDNLCLDDYPAEDKKPALVKIGVGLEFGEGYVPAGGRHSFRPQHGGAGYDEDGENQDQEMQPLHTFSLDRLGRLSSC